MYFPERMSSEQRSRQRRGRRRFAVYVLILLAHLPFCNPPNYLQAAQEPPPPIEGVVVNLAQIGADFFAQLDVNGDGQGDVWVKIVGSILDMEGTELTPDQIENGARLKVTDYQQNEAGFVEAYIVVLISAAGGSQGQSTRPDAPATVVNVYVRLVGAPRPPTNLYGTDNDAWICVGESVQVFWVTTPDVTLISLGESLGTFRANQGGMENGLNWGSVLATPQDTISYQISAVDGTFSAGGSATVFVYGHPQPAGPFQSFPEGNIQAQLQGNTARVNAIDAWAADLSDVRFSPHLAITDIKPGKGAIGSGFTWRVRKESGDGTVTNFNIAAVDTFQHPFRPDDTDEALPLSGDWTFSTLEDIAEKSIGFVIRPVCR